jgi:hypothetical protein
MGTIINVGGRCGIVANVSARGYSDNIFAGVYLMCDGMTFEMVYSDHDRHNLDVGVHYELYYPCAVLSASTRR